MTRRKAIWPLVMLLLLALTCSVLMWKPSVSAASRGCRMVFVHSAGKYVNLYATAGKTVPVANPFVAFSDEYEIHVAGATDLDIREQPCQPEGP